MARTNTATGSGRNKKSRRTPLILIAAAAAIIIGLIWKEQVALLYVLATLSVVALLLVVAFADLGGARQLTAPAPNDDAAAAGDGSVASHNASARTATRR